MKYFEFKADQVFGDKDENDILICSFAEGNEPDPEKYIILQKVLDRDELYAFEICSLDSSGEGGFESIHLSKDILWINFHQSLQEKYDFLGLKIHLKKDESIVDIAKYLKLIFKDSDCVFSVENDGAI